MEVNQINNNQQQNYLISIVNDLRDKYKLLEEKQNMNEKISIKNKDNILNLNKNIGIVYKLFLNFKNQSEKNFEEKNKNLLNLENNIKKNEINGINNEQIKNIEKKYEEISNKIDAKFEELKKEIEQLKNDISMKNKELEQLKIYINIKNRQLEQVKNEVNIKNKELERAKNDVNLKNKEIEHLKTDINSNNVEFKIDENEGNTVFEKFENLLGQVMSKNDISVDDLDKFEKISEKLIINDISPLNEVNKYFKDTVKLLFKESELSDINNEKLGKYCEIKKKIYVTVEKIENQLTEKYLKNKKVTNKTKNPANYIERFRQNYGIRQEDASDNDIILYLKKNNGNEFAAYKAIMQKYSP